MAAGLAVVSPAVGDVAAIVSVANQPLITPPGDEAALCAALVKVAADPASRAATGAANRARAFAEFGEEAMIDAYRRTYAAALKRADFP